MFDDLLTATEIAARLDVRFYRIRYLLNARPEIQPTHVVRGCRYYGPTAVRAISDELAAIDAKRRERIPA